MPAERGPQTNNNKNIEPGPRRTENWQPPLMNSVRAAASCRSLSCRSDHPTTRPAFACWGECLEGSTLGRAGGKEALW
jgi:hypothetical protein